MEKVYIVYLTGMGCGTDSSDWIICEPEQLEGVLTEMEWEHHDQWAEPNEDDDQECEAEAYAEEYTPENYRGLDLDCCGGGSFLEEAAVREVWEAHGWEVTL